jgi:hypothetical protein
MSKVGKTKDNLKKCLCRKCPTFINASKLHPELLSQPVIADADLGKLMHMENFYCAYGKSKLIEDKKVCLCFSCKVFKEFKLIDGYFCVTDELLL